MEQVDLVQVEEAQVATPEIKITAPEAKPSDPWEASVEVQWSEWTSMGGIGTSAPSAAVDAEGLIHVFSRGITRALTTTRQAWKGGEIVWEPWESLGGALSSSPRLACSAEPVLPVLDGGGVDRVGDLTGIVAHTCNLTAGGLLAGESRGVPPLNCYGSVR